MTKHLFAGRPEGETMIVTSGITLCCSAHVSGLPIGDTGTVVSGQQDCPGPVEERRSSESASDG